MSHSLILTILLFFCTSNNIFATSIQIINNTNYSFLISDHQLQTIIIPSQQSYHFDLEQVKPLYFYFSEKNNYFKLICTIREKLISQQPIKLQLNDILIKNFIIYPQLFFIPAIHNFEKQTLQPSTIITCPTTEQDTLGLLNSIQQQQQIARETYQENNPVKPMMRRNQINNDAPPTPESLVQKISTIAASRSQNGHQFAKSSRKN